MKLVTLKPVVDIEKCKGCKTCVKVCPVLAMSMEEKLAVPNLELCRGCGDCEQRCPEYAITMVVREEPVMAKVEM
ncbi:MAG: 4Fe-4S binding protein, partial [Desulfomonilaceae bacterium]